MDERFTEVVANGAARTCFLADFHRHVRATPGAPAVSVGEYTYSYAELQHKVAHYARALSGHGIGPGAKVGVAVARKLELLALLLAVWQVRAAYVPIDPNYPQARQAYLLDDAEVDLLISDNLLLNRPGSPPTLDLAALELAGRSADGDLPESACDATDVAYLIYTSGSTGNPKGVAVTQGNLANFLHAMAERPGMQAHDRLLAVTTISFDIHILELFLPLAVGAHLVLADERQTKAQSELRRLLETWQITMMQATPATWRIILAEGWRPRQALRLLIGGEALPADLRGALHSASHQLWNMYGPTETTVWSTCALIKPEATEITIGSAIANTTLVVVDDQLQPVAAGVVGELLIGGAGVAQGYYRKPDLTAKRFVALAAHPGVRFYRTGDLVVLNADGELKYINRRDNQIKLRGFRVEPAEVERTLELLPGVQQCVVVAAEFAADDRRLCAFYLGETQSAQALLAHCQAVLPAHMIPQHFVQLDALPMTANLKVDRNQLMRNGASLMQSVKTPTSQARDDLDLSLIAVWERALGVRGIGIDDDFFHLGGHSLLALQVTRDMHKVTGIEFPNTLIFEASTIRSLLEQVGEKVQSAASVVRLNDAEQGEPLFCLCGVRIYQALANCYKKRRPIYGVFSKEEIAFIEAERQQTDIHISFDLLVQAYVDAILRQGDLRKVSLAGFSFGGLMALEVAKKLQAKGVVVGQIILLDSYFATSTYRSLRETTWHLTRALVDPVHRQNAWFQIRRLARKLSNRLRGVKDFSREFAQREKAFDRAANAYKTLPKHYPFNVLLIKASHTDFGFGQRSKRDYGLAEFIAGELRVVEVDTDHVNMLREKAINKVFQLMTDYDQAAEIV